MEDVWVEECCVAGSVQGQAKWESRALGGEGRTEPWSLKEGMGMKKMMQRRAPWLTGNRRCKEVTRPAAKEKGII